MGKVNYKKEKIPFTQIANGLIYDKNLSAKAKGVYCYLYAKPDGWDFSAKRIQEDFTDGRKGINSALQELEDNGYLERNRQPDGRVVYYLKYPPTQSPQMGHRVPDPKSPKGKVPKRQSAQKGHISNKDIKEIKKRKEIKNSDVPSQENNQELEVSKNKLIVDVIDAFQGVNPNYGSWYQNKTQRQAIEDLLAQVGEQSLLKAIQFLPVSNSTPYMPVITTPYQLREKWAHLATAWQRKKAEKETERNKHRQIVHDVS